MGMARLTRAQQQERTRAAVLAAAENEFAEQGYADAKVDRIAERAELTRGAVYSNFPSKRALYLAVLVHLVERGEAAPATARGGSLGAFARVWLERLPMATDPPGGQLRCARSPGLSTTTGPHHVRAGSQGWRRSCWRSRSRRPSPRPRGGSGWPSWFWPC